MATNNSINNHLATNYDANGNVIQTWNPTASAVNYISFSNQATTLPPAINVQGSDTNISIVLSGKATGGIIAETPSGTIPLSMRIGSNFINNSVPTLTGTRTITYPDANRDLTVIPALTSTAGLTLLSTNNAQSVWSTSPPITKINVQSFSSAGSGIYTPTSGMVYVLVMAQAAGGGSGGAATTDNIHIATAGGGGGGEYFEVLFTAAQIGTSQPYVIGAAGTGGAVGNNAGGNGGNTTFNTSWIVAVGGLGGAGSAATTSAPAVNAVSAFGGGGGSFSTGSLVKHAVGSASGLAVNLTVSNGYPGSGGTAGNGSAGAASIIAAAQPGTPGALGSGASGAMTANGTQQSGAAGGAGFITFLEFISV